jgi:hypothetical protein
MPRAGFSIDFIVRIYRCNTKKPRPLLGTVEKVGEKGKLAFTTREELWEILHAPPTDRQKDNAHG